MWLCSYVENAVALKSVCRIVATEDYGGNGKEWRWGWSMGINIDNSVVLFQIEGCLLMIIALFHVVRV